jgi:hypothetical protein
MRLVEILEGRRQALRVSEVANLLCVTPQHITRWPRGVHCLRCALRARFDLIPRIWSTG